MFGILSLELGSSEGLEDRIDEGSRLGELLCAIIGNMLGSFVNGMVGSDDLVVLGLELGFDGGGLVGNTESRASLLLQISITTVSLAPNEDPSLSPFTLSPFTNSSKYPLPAMPSLYESYMLKV